MGDRGGAKRGRLGVDPGRRAPDEDVPGQVGFRIGVPVQAHRTGRRRRHLRQQHQCKDEKRPSEPAEESQDHHALTKGNGRASGSSVNS